ncbi:zinc ribbon domain-containing protein [Nocardioides sp. B-3]|uniref:zinc ribbon domain-containing protein n=1 Tax=Nocardioides sp. B-3 TaxID=2895565 RepID=UPI0021521831|nr:C4-type zinc ribbon domain-containing protein [Nocardioides sp. B-3]UUZ58615.1 C4-type zinc ribbon domain-containing protein [Nocardioides sp. B-3]
MKADPSAQQQLLAVQELDSRADQLRHQRASLPETVRIAELETGRGDVDDRLRDARIVVDDLTVEQKKADADVEQVKVRRTRDRDRMDRGLITNPKDLERMQHELESLERRITSLEDAELEVMEKLEEAQKTADTLAAQLAETDAQVAELAVVRDARWVEIDASLAEAESARAEAVRGLPEDLLALYERLRAKKGGVGAAALRARQCGGCQLTIDAAELGVIRAKAADEVVRCEECDRISVRTSESGI